MKEVKEEEEEAEVRGLWVIETEIRLVPVSKPTCIRRVPSLIDSPDNDNDKQLAVRGLSLTPSPSPSLACQCPLAPLALGASTS